MFDVGDRVKVQLRGELHSGVVTKTKWGLAFVDFEGGRKNDWIDLKRLEKDHAIPNTDRK